jgi:hypothetical protein
MVKAKAPPGVATLKLAALAAWNRSRNALMQALPRVIKRSKGLTSMNGIDEFTFMWVRVMMGGFGSLCRGLNIA